MKANFLDLKYFLTYKFLIHYLGPSLGLFLCRTFGYDKIGHQVPKSDFDGDKMLLFQMST